MNLRTEDELIRDLDPKWMRELRALLAEQDRRDKIRELFLTTA